MRKNVPRGPARVPVPVPAKALLDRSRQAWNDGRLEDLLACYAEEAVIVLGTREPIIGVPRLRDVFIEGLATGMKLQALDVHGAWPTDLGLWLFGDYETLLRPGVGPVETGTVVMCLTGRAPGWRIASEFWSARPSKPTTAGSTPSGPT